MKANASPILARTVFSPQRRRWLALGAAATAAFGLAACAGGASSAGSAASAVAGQAQLPAGGSSKAALLERARAFWSAALANDRVTTWQLEEISRDPDSTLQGYLQRSGVVYDAVDVRGVSQLGDGRAAVTIEMQYSVPALHIRRKRQTMQDQWVLLDGQWYHARQQGVSK